MASALKAPPFETAAIGQAPAANSGLNLGAAFRIRTVSRAIVFATLYLLAMLVAIETARFGGRVSPLWIASAILAWALITSPLLDWPLLIIATAGVHVAHGLAAGYPIDIELTYLAANIVSPLLCAALLRRQGDNLAFETRGAFVRFLAIAGVVAPGAAAAIVGASSVIRLGHFDAQSTGMLYLSESLGLTVFLPIFRSFVSGDLKVMLGSKTRTRAAGLFAGFFALHAVGWLLPGSLHNFFSMAMVPYAIYMAFELGEAGARLAVALTAVIIIAYALLGGSGPNNIRGPEFVLAAQVYIASLAVSVLPLAHALAEKKRLYETVSEALSDAQAAWGQLIAAEAHYRLIADNTTDMILRLGRDGVIVFASPACKLLSADVERLTGKSIGSLANKDDAPRIRRELAAFAGEAVYDRPHTMRLRLRDTNDVYHDFDARLTLVSARLGEGEEFIAVLRQVGA